MIGPQRIDPGRLTCQDQPIDPEIADLMKELDSLDYVQTLYSCAGCGVSGFTGELHLGFHAPYFMLHFDLSSPRALDLHERLARVVGRADWELYPDTCSYQLFRTRPHRSRAHFWRTCERRWRRVRAAVREHLEATSRERSAG